MSCPTVTASREVLVIRWMREFVPSIRAALRCDFNFAMRVLCEAGDLCFASGLDVEDCIREVVSRCGGEWTQSK